MTEQILYYSLYYDFDKNIANICSFDGEITEFSKLSFIYSLVNFTKSAKVIVYINRLQIIEKMLKEFLDMTVCDTDVPTITNGECLNLKEPIELRYKVDKTKLIFRDFDRLISKCDYKGLAKLYSTDRIDFAMVRYITDIGKGDYRKVKYTLASNSKRIFYEDIKDELEQIIKDDRMKVESIEDWKLLYAGNKAGRLTEIDQMFFEKDIVSFDMRSAYSYITINDNHFPKGKTNSTILKSKKKEIMDSGKWFKVIFKKEVWEKFISDFYILAIESADVSKVDLLNVEKACKENEITKAAIDMYDSRVELAAFEISDTKLYDLIGLDWKMLIEKFPCLMLYTKESDYLPNCIREKQFALYNRKQSLDDCFEKSIIKSQLQFTYGKPIEFRDWSSDAQVYMHYRRGDNFLQPHYSNHISAEIRYILRKIQFDLDEKAIYEDTDSLKFKYSEKVMEYFNRLNNDIIKSNAEKGFDCDCGTWKFEGRFEESGFFAKKCYVLRNGETIDVKASGATEFSKEILEAMHFNKLKSLKENFRSGLPLYLQKYDIQNMLLDKSMIVFSPEPFYIASNDELEKVRNKTFKKLVEERMKQSA